MGSGFLKAKRARRRAGVTKFRRELVRQPQIVLQASCGRGRTMEDFEGIHRERIWRSPGLDQVEPRE